jgi:CBS domain-containing protein
MALEDGSILARAAELPPDDDSLLHRDFERVEERVAGPGGRDALLQLAGALVQACGAVHASPRATQPGTARDVMREPPGIAAPDDSLSRAVEIMERGRRREVAVVEHGRLVGMLARSDLEPYRGHMEWTTVRAAMTSDPVSVVPDTAIPATVRILLERDINCVPVTVDGRLVGMVRRVDLLRTLAPRDPASGTRPPGR